MIQILIVEDDENISKMLAATLSIGGYSYAQCGDGLEAVERITAGNYDLILLDVMLPGADGFAVLDTIRARGCETPVIFLTALGAVADKVKGLRGGAEDYIVKPFEAVELLARIEVVLRRAGKSEMRLRYGDIRVDIERHTVTKAGVPVVLTPKEFDVLVFSCAISTWRSRASSFSRMSGSTTTPANPARWTSTCSRCAASSVYRES